jgi:hypothetical protein
LSRLVCKAAVMGKFLRSWLVEQDALLQDGGGGDSFTTVVAIHMAVCCPGDVYTCKSKEREWQWQWQ